MKENFEKIDLVVPYVDNSDPEWHAVFISEQIKAGLATGVEEATAKNRFRSDTNFFRFFFRAVAQNLKFINRIFLIVMSESQVPSWINRDEVTIVTHDEFIPTKFLPTFNSGVIEMFIQNIPNLSEKFIYANDDFYAMAPMNAKDFFLDNKTKFNLIKDNNADKNMWRQMCKNNHMEIFNKLLANDSFYRLDHEFRPYIKSQMTECFNSHKQKIYNSCTQFRSKANMTIFLYSLYAHKNNTRLNSNLKNIYQCSTSTNESIKNMANTCHCLCINDTDAAIDKETDPEIIKMFYDKFNTQSKYELTTFDFITHVKKCAQEQSKSRVDKLRKLKDYCAGRAETFLYF